MTTSRTIAPAAALIGIAGALGFGILYKRADGENATLRASAERMQRLEDEMQSIGRDVRGINRVAALTLANAARPGETPPSGESVAESGLRRPSEPPPGFSPEEDRKRDEAERVRRQVERDRLDRVVASEARNPGWARGAESAVRTALAKSELSGTSLTSIDCRSTICRIEVEHSEPIDEAKFGTQFPVMVPELTAGTFMRVERPNGKVATIGFMSTDAEILRTE